MSQQQFQTALGNASHKVKQKLTLPHSEYIKILECMYLKPGVSVEMSEEIPKIKYRTGTSSARNTTLQRYINKFYPEKEIPTKVLDELAKEFASHFTLGEITIEQGTIQKRYQDQFGGRSCMTDRSELVEIYDRNGVELLTYRNQDKTARALLWTADCGTKILDRIYPSDGGWHMEQIRKYTDEHGIKRARNCNYKEPYYVTWTEGLDLPFPYMDSFRIKEYSQKSVVLTNGEDVDVYLDYERGWGIDNFGCCEECGHDGYLWDDYCIDCK